MRKVLSIFLSFVMFISIFSVLNVTVYAVEASDHMYIEASDFSDGKVTYKIYLKEDRKFTAAINRVIFDPDILTPVGVEFLGDYGNGLYTEGLVADTDNIYSLATVSNNYTWDSDLHGYEFATITFAVKKSVCTAEEASKVEFYCVEFNSSEEEQEIPHDSQNPSFIGSLTIGGEGHTPSDWVVDKAPTCEETGSKHKVCGICSEIIETSDIDAKGHMSTGWIIDIDASCEKSGSMHKECSVCKAKLQYGEISPKGHVSSDWIVGKKPTVEEEGTRYKECTICGKTLETESIPKLVLPEIPAITSVLRVESGVKIVWNEAQYADSYIVYRKTETSSWTNLGTVSETSFIDTTAKLGNIYYYTIKAQNEAGISDYDKTGVSIEYADENPYNLTFTLSDDASYLSVTGCDKSQKGHVIIPAKFNGYPVKSIENSAFYGCEEITSVAISDSVTRIGASAFSGCKKLISISIPNSVTTIGRFCFSDCESLASITIPESVINMDWYYTFSGCASLGVVTIPENTQCIDDGAFSGCTGLTSVIIPVSIKNIGQAAFWHCNNLTNIHYAGSITQWSKIYVEGDNECLTNANVYFDIIEKPATPKLISASRTATGVKLTWGEVLGANEYVVYRKTAKSGWTNLGTTTLTSFTDTKVKTGTTYYYTVRAQNEAGLGGFHKTGIAVKYVAAPKLTKIANKSSGVRVYWSKVSGADGYYLYRRVAGSKTWTKVATVKKGSTTSYLDKKASAGKTYEYIIKAYDGSTVSASAAKVIKIKRLTVPKLSSAKSGKSGVTVKWGKVAGASGYIVYRKTGKGSWVQLKSLEGNTKVSYVDKSAKKGKTYTYTVRAYSGSYKSAYNTKGLTVKDKY